jgi:nucleoside-diphosphate-sugar epimerase
VVGVSPRFVFSGAVRPGDAQRWVADLTRIRAIGYSTGFSLREGIARTYRWYRQSVLPFEGARVDGAGTSPVEEKESIQ